MNKKQASFGVVLSILLIAFGWYLYSQGNGMALHLITGLGFGYILAKSSYGFAGGVKIIYLTGDGSLTRALLIMLAITLIMTTGIHWFAANNGAVASYLATEGMDVIPGTGNVAPITLKLIIGGLLFGIGMMLAGGCASGTLTGFGTGWGGSLIAIIFFGVGGLLGDLILPKINESFLNKGSPVYFPEKMGYPLAFVLSMLLIGGTYVFTQWYESKRRREGTFSPLDLVEDVEISDHYEPVSEETYNMFLGRGWSLKTGAVLISAMFIFTLVTTGSNWGVSGPYAIWTARFLQLFGINPETGGAAGTFAAASGGILNHGVSVRNIGIILGATLAALFCGVFAIDFDFTPKDAFYYGLGGILMGIGAKLASGCNVGAFYSAIVSHSLSGWIFMLTLIIGGVFALNLFAGKVNLIPDKD